MNWVLIVIMHWSNAYPAMMRFPNQKSCEAAKDWFESNAPYGIYTICLEDQKK